MVLTRRGAVKLLIGGIGLQLLAACAPAAPASPTSAPKTTDASASKPAAAAPVSTAAPAPTAPKPAAAAPPAAATTTAPAAQVTGTLQFWMYKTRLDPFDIYRTERIQAWSKQSGVKVDVTEIPTSDYGKRIPAAIESKTLPDVLEAGDTWGQLLQPRGLLADLSEVYQRIDREQKFSPLAKMLSIWPDGKAYLIPVGTSGKLLISRDDQMKAAGLEPPPKTWADFFDYAARAQRPPRTFGIGTPLSNTSDSNEWLSVFQAYGVRVADDTGKKAMFGNHKAEAVQVIELLADAYENKKSFPPGVLTWDQTGDNDAFQSGRTLFAFNSLTIPAWMRDNKPELFETVGTYVYPVGPKAHVQGGDGVGMSVRADSKLLDKINDLIYFLYDRDYYKDFYSLGQWGPTTEAHYDNVAFSQSWLKVRVELAKTGKPAGWPDVNNEPFNEAQTQFIIPRMMQRVISDKMPPDKSFEVAAEEYATLYKKYESRA
jgi:multiple sugar transport system substrate-binding protein